MSSGKSKGSRKRSRKRAKGAKPEAHDGRQGATGEGATGEGATGEGATGEGAIVDGIFARARDADDQERNSSDVAPDDAVTIDAVTIDVTERDADDVETIEASKGSYSGASAVDADESTSDNADVLEHGDGVDEFEGDGNTVELSADAIEEIGSAENRPPSTVEIELSDDDESVVEIDDDAVLETIELDDGGSLVSSGQGSGLAAVDLEPDILLDAIETVADDERRWARMEALLADEAAFGDDRGRRAVIHHELGYLFLQELGDEARAIKSFAKALSIDPLLRANLWGIRRIFASRELWPNVLKLFEAQLRLEEDPAQRMDVLLDRGRVYLDRLHDAEKALESFWQAHEADKTSIGPLLAIQALASETKDDKLLLTVAEKMVAVATDDAQKVALLRQFARLQLSLADDAEAAWVSLEKAYELGFDALSTSTQMLLHARQCNSVERQVDILGRQAGLHAEEKDNLVAAACLREAAWLVEHSLQDLDSAYEILGNALLLLDKGSDEAVALAKHRSFLAERLGDWRTLIESTERALELAETDGEKRAALALRLYRYRNAAKAPNARHALDLALEAVPGYLPALVEYERDCLAAADHERLADIYQYEANAAAAGGGALGGEEDTVWAADAYWRAAFVVGSQGGDADRAIAFCKKALAKDGEHWASQNLLAELLQQHGRFDELFAFLSERKDAGEAGLLPQLISLAGGPLDDPSRQVTLLREYAQLNPQDRAIQERLVEALTRVDDDTALVNALKTLEDLETDDKAKNQARVRRAELMLGRLNQEAEALELYGRVLATDPGNAYALVALESQHTQLNPSQVLEAAVEISDLPDDIRRNFHLKLAMQFELAAKYQDAVRIYEAMLETRPDDRNAEIGRLRSARLLGDWKKVALILSAELARGTDPEAKSRRLLTLAELNNDVLEDPERYEDLLKEIVDNPAAPDRVVDAMDALARRMIVQGNHAQAVEYLATIAADAPTKAHDVFVEEQAWLLSETLDRSEEGEALWTRLKEKGASASAAWALCQRAAADRDISTLAGLSEELSHRVEDKALVGQLCLRAGNFADLVGGRGSEATEAYRRALVLDGDCMEARWGLAAQDDLEGAERSENLEKLRHWLPEDAMQQLNLDSALALMRAGQNEEARQRLAPLLAKDPDHLPALALVQRIAQTTGNKRLEAQIWLRMGTAFPSESKARSQAWRAGAELLVQVDAVAAAGTVYRELVALGCDEPGTYERLTELYQRLGADADLEALYGHQLATLPADAMARVDLYFSRAQLRLEKRDDLRGCARDLTELLKLDSGHRPALKQLASLFLDDEQFIRAEELYTQYFDLADDRKDKRDALYQRIACNRALNSLAPAAEACQAFLDLWADDKEVWGTLVDLREGLSDREGAVAALDKLVALEDDPELQAQAYARAGDLLRDTDAKAAKGQFARAQDLARTDIEILSRLRQCCLAVGAERELQQALDRCQDDLWEALSGDDLGVETIGKIMQVAEWGEDQHRLFTALGVLGFLGSSSPQEQELYRRRVDMMRFKPAGGISEGQVHDALTLPTATANLGAVWNCIAFSMPKLFSGLVPATPEMAGVSDGEARLMRNSGGPASAAILQIAALLNVGDFDIYLSQRKPDVVTGICHEKYRALVIGHAVVSSMGAQQRFHAGRQLALLRDDAAALASLTVADVELAMAAAIRLGDPKAKLPVNDETVDPVVRRLEAALPRKRRKTLVGAVAELGSGPVEITEWVNALRFGANRSGLLVCGDIRAALTIVVGTKDGEAGPSDPQEALRRVVQEPEAADLLRFAFSRDYTDLRRVLGV